MQKKIVYLLLLINNAFTASRDNQDIRSLMQSKLVASSQVINKCIKQDSRILKAKRRGDCSSSEEDEGHQSPIGKYQSKRKHINQESRLEECLMNVDSRIIAQQKQVLHSQLPVGYKNPKEKHVFEPIGEKQSQDLFADDLYSDDDSQDLIKSRHTKDRNVIEIKSNSPTPILYNGKLKQHLVAHLIPMISVKENEDVFDMGNMMDSLGVTGSILDMPSFLTPPRPAKIK